MSIRALFYPAFLLTIATSIISLSSCSFFNGAYGKPSGSGQAEVLSLFGEVIGDASGRRGLFGGEKAVFGRPFVMPVDVGASGEYVYIVDAGRRSVYRYNRFTNLLTEFSRFPVDMATKILVTPDSSFYLTDPPRGRILYYDRLGKLVRIIKNLVYLSNPVAITMDEQSGDIFVADGTFNHIVVFNRIGDVIQTINLLVGKRFDGMASIADLTFGSDGLYLVDKVEREIVVLDRNGNMRYSFGKKSLREPVAVSIDIDGRVFVADQGDNSIKVFSAGKLEFVFEGSGHAGGRFIQIEDMTLYNRFLYVADSSGGKTLILSVNPARMNR